MTESSIASASVGTIKNSPDNLVEDGLVEGSMTLSDLQLKGWRIKPGNIEAYLTDDEFIKAFHVTSRQDFYNLPKWKQEQLKKDLKLM